jgi:1-acyl-sn-glycerol-3-phosphate acyltransferase
VRSHRARRVSFRSRSLPKNAVFRPREASNAIFRIPYIELCSGLRNFHHQKYKKCIKMACQVLTKNEIIVRGIGILVVLFLLPKLKYLFSSQKNIWKSTGSGDLNWFQRMYFGSIKEFSEFWNEMEFHGSENVDNQNCLLVGYHSRCTVDLVYLAAHLQPNVIVSHLLFKIPVFGMFMSQINLISSKSNNSKTADMGFVNALVAGKRPLLLLPGGAYECLKQSSQKGKIQWKPNPGFARVICSQSDYLGSKTKVVPFYTKNCDECYYYNEEFYNWSGTWGRKTYSMFKKGHVYLLPIMMTIIAFSLGFVIFPRPIKLDTYFGAPLVMHAGETDVAFATRVGGATQELIDNVQKMPIRSFKKRSVWSRILSVVLSCYMIAQNLLFKTILLVSIWSPVIAVVVAFQTKFW